MRTAGVSKVKLCSVTSFEFEFGSADKFESADKFVSKYITADNH